MRPGQRDHAGEVLAFWFVETRPRQWFAKDPAFDALVRERFLGLTQRALSGELDAWGAEAAGGLALVLLFDQFPRQIWRDTAMALAGDPQALALSLQAVEQGWLEAEPEQTRRQFWLMPKMHAEELAVQEAALPLFARFCDPRTAEQALRVLPCCWASRSSSGSMRTPITIGIIVKRFVQQLWAGGRPRRIHQRSMRIQSHQSRATGSSARNNTSRL